MRAFIEGDFRRIEPGLPPAPRLRAVAGPGDRPDLVHLRRPEAEPDGIDFEGLNAIALFRQPQLRYTHGFGERYSVAAALENPAPDITNAQGVSRCPTS